MRVCFEVDEETALALQLARTKLGKSSKEISSLERKIGSIIRRDVRQITDKAGIKLTINQDGKCPKCKEGKLTKRKHKEREFYGCSKYPKCRFTKPIKQ
ncbi:topoisomerase DNA-binding C4 zinc finger domain-containing protein [Vibrio alginolyticus]|uniref:topoisomerase DNA-binding C4 zinc finger domain-containing protein n=1 Tax=Vibrio alginolyticus TaxID=663 RepID=UPI0006CA9653|nr:hypothetical protein AOG25_08890 [Vibrio alginolyticus]